MSRNVITQFAPAKVNLTLHITGRRADGYHLIDSIFVFPDIGDEISVSPSDTLSLTISGEFAHFLKAEQNLVLKAAELLRAKTGVIEGAAIHLTKTLPIAAGLGGGSADAAAALRALQALWEVTLTDAQLKEITAELGADVLACYYSTPTRVTGIGEILAPLPPLPPLYILLINPKVTLLTAQVYKEFSGTFSTPAAMENWPQDAEGFCRMLKTHWNDLQVPAARLFPPLMSLLANIEKQAGCMVSRMSGSGATCFGLFPLAEAATAAASALQHAHPSWWIKTGKL